VVGPGQRKKTTILKVVLPRFIPDQRAIHRFVQCRHRKGYGESPQPAQISFCQWLRKTATHDIYITQTSCIYTIDNGATSPSYVTSPANLVSISSQFVNTPRLLNQTTTRDHHRLYNQRQLRHPKAHSSDPLPS